MYVDDMLVNVNQSILLDDFLMQLKQKFAIKDPGQVHHFLGIQVETINSRIFLSQSRYAMKVIRKENLVDRKPLHSNGFEATNS